MSEWTDRLQPASFRGVPFAVRAAVGRFGRRQAVHEYPFRDSVWVEDLGRSARRIAIEGFLIENSLIYGGGDVILQKERMIAAAETPGPTTLVHPTLGSLLVSLDQPLEIQEQDGLIFRLRFTFIEAGLRVFPAGAASTQDQTKASAQNANTAMAGDFGTEMLA